MIEMVRGRNCTSGGTSNTGFELRYLGSGQMANLKLLGEIHIRLPKLGNKFHLDTSTAQLKLVPIEHLNSIQIVPIRHNLLTWHIR